MCVYFLWCWNSLSEIPHICKILFYCATGEHPAAMQTGSASLMPLSATSLLFATFIVLTLSSAYDFDATQTRLQIDEGKNRKQDKSHHQSASYETISTDHSLHQCSHDKNTMISNAVIPGRDGEVEMQSRVTGENSIRVSKILEHSSVTACNTAWADVGCWKIESGIHKPAIFIGITADEEAVSFNRNSPVICVAESSPLYCSSWRGYVWTYSFLPREYLYQCFVSMWIITNNVCVYKI